MFIKPPTPHKPPAPLRTTPQNVVFLFRGAVAGWNFNKPRGAVRVAVWHYTNAVQTAPHRYFLIYKNISHIITNIYIIYIDHLLWCYLPCVYIYMFKLLNLILIIFQYKLMLVLRRQIKYYNYICFLWNNLLVLKSFHLYHYHFHILVYISFDEYP